MDAVVEGTYGAVTIHADGTWSYALNEADPDTAAINGETTDVFSYTVSDGHGGFDTALLNIKIYDATHGGGVPNEGGGGPGDF